jgi:hypothetical protein
MAPPARKRAYEPPKLHSVQAIEAGSAVCCKTNSGACSAAAKSGGGKGQRSKDTS